MPNEHDAAKVRKLIAQAGTVARASGQHPLRSLLIKMSRGRHGRRHGWPVVPDLGTPWQDTISGERSGWRARSAWVNGIDFAFSVDYQICRRCHVAWVELPHTEPRYQRCGLATAGLEALRNENPGLSWHTLGGHFPYARGFWQSVGAEVQGGYVQREPCSHIAKG